MMQFVLTRLLVRTVIELIKNETYYASMYSEFVGPMDIAIKSVCKNYMFSELHEIGALCSVLGCNIRSIYPRIDFQQYMAMLNRVFTPAPPVVANCNIAILWSHALRETAARAANHGKWSPNHFVPLLSPAMRHESDDSNMSISINVGYLFVHTNMEIFQTCLDP
jgi:hypothetical protein